MEQPGGLQDARGPVPIGDGLTIVPTSPSDAAWWQVWSEDTFDREAPRRVKVEGEGLEKGLVELWVRHLSE